MTQSPELKAWASAAAKALNLKPHPIGGSGPAPTTCALPFDAEGHLGRDARLYVVGTTRVFPAAAKVFAHEPSCARLVRQLRPEFVMKYSTALSPDGMLCTAAAAAVLLCCCIAVRCVVFVCCVVLFALRVTHSDTLFRCVWLPRASHFPPTAFTRLGSVGGGEQHNTEVQEATEVLVTKVVPFFVQTFRSYFVPMLASLTIEGVCAAPCCVGVVLVLCWSGVVLCCVVL
jgi:hypothetical protein